MVVKRAIATTPIKQVTVLERPDEPEEAATEHKQLAKRELRQQDTDHEQYQRGQSSKRAG